MPSSPIDLTCLREIICQTATTISSLLEQLNPDCAVKFNAMPDGDGEKESKTHFQQANTRPERKTSRFGLN